ncbi:MAG: DUF2249 domain-containing protein [Lapillicoccus sp.]
MNTVVIASTEADASAASAVEQHHAQMAGALALKVQTVLNSVVGGVDADVRTSAEQLVAWCENELIPHATAEEATLYAAARRRPEGKLLVDGMLAEHTVILDLVREIADATSPLSAATAARALQVVFDSHLEKENSLVLPLLVAAPDISVADLLGGLHELVGGASTHEDPEDAHGGHACACGESDGDQYPELDARAIPHAIRHATIFGALAAIRPGGGMVLVAPHDPKPLLAQVEQRNPGVFAVEYLEQGPQDWRLAFVRQPV